ncbi:MoxR-like ATPase [Salinarchaeum sp. Harcht-Bsk1]|uniref:AAA family ATPase n=1 Tax=Salinarchaeum sp. Harcht-Bsk1 TaxID=1333523 RepID=UPI00034247B1|nr:MoxR family ATPase [Salinarchaeum sp. Harcht-Bsk1]AGN02451.1 MoxR-like ATPase [Salinarchaeum sp. Harcht-Bsk1]
MTDTNTSRVDDASLEGSVEPLPIDAAGTVADDVVANVEQVMVGQRATIEHVFGAMLAGGHVLIEDVPGVGKTMLVRALARSVDSTFGRIQFTPDLLPSDVTGVSVYNQKTREFEFQPGPVFANLVLGDEINRAPPKTQSALLEAMEEEQVTVDGETRSLPSPFTVIATQNAVEPNRTYELPMAELDRFMKKLSVGYPDADQENEMVDRVLGTHPIDSLSPVTDVETLQRLGRTVAEVTVREPVRTYATELARFTRENAALGVSPRGTITLLQAAQARAVLDGREFVVPDDVKAEARPVLTHRIRTGVDAESSDDLLDRALETITPD